MAHVKMKNLIVVFTLMIVISTGWIENESASIDWTILKTDSLLFKRIFSEDEIRRDNLTEKDINKAIDLVRINFDSIKYAININESLSISDFKLQFVGGINNKNEKVVFVNCVGKKLPIWIQANWKTRLIQLKCSQDNLVSLKLNLYKRNCYQAYKGECE
jgi:hypothetical protein